MSFRDLALCVACSCSCLVLACSGTTDSHGTGGDDLAGGNCNVVPKTVSGLTASHVTQCSELDYPDNPPAGGNHYPVWAAFQTFSYAVPRGFWVHDLEHGAVVYSYNCTDGCPDEVAAGRAVHNDAVEGGNGMLARTLVLVVSAVALVILSLTNVFGPKQAAR